MPPRKRKVDKDEPEQAVAAPAAKAKKGTKPKATATTRKKPKTTTTKDKILAILASHHELLCAQRIKKLLVSEYGMPESGAFNTNVNKTLKPLCEQQEALGDVFGKIGGSYHGGVSSKAYLDSVAAVQQQEEARMHEQNGHMLCCYCNTWAESEFIREDSAARGSLERCGNPACGEEFWTWISDNCAHTQEYKYGQQ